MTWENHAFGLTRSGACQAFLSRCRSISPATARRCRHAVAAASVEGDLEFHVHMPGGRSGHRARHEPLPRHRPRPRRRHHAAVRPRRVRRVDRDDPAPEARNRRLRPGPAGGRAHTPRSRHLTPFRKIARKWTIRSIVERIEVHTDRSRCTGHRALRERRPRRQAAHGTVTAVARPRNASHAAGWDRNRHFLAGLPRIKRD